MENMPPIRTVIFREGDTWVAQCIEYDIGTQAPDYPTLRRRLSAVVQAEYEESMRRFGKPFAGIGAAPAEYAERWARQDEHLVPSKSDPNKKQEGFEFQLALCA